MELLALTADGKLSYTPDPGFTGSDVFQYTVSDGNGGTDQTGVDIYVSGIDTRGEVGSNINPIAEYDDLTVDSSPNQMLDVLANDSDADGDSLTITSYTQPANGTITLTADGMGS